MTTRADSTYRPDIDGLRAVAIIPVLAFHVRPEWLPGGYLGVDVFFVISGYLITSILLRELADGQFGLVRFWTRRIRRIVPSLVLVTATTLLAARLTTFAPTWPSLARQGLATLGSVANVTAWRMTGDYWGTQAEDAPLLHMWSLSLEEQFYAVVPLLLLTTWRHARRALLPLLALVTVGSYIVFVIGLFRAPVATFYLLPSRAWELGVGACLGTLVHHGWPGGGHRRLRHVGAVAALTAVLASYRLLPHMSPWTAVPVLGSAAVIAGGGGGACGRLLSWPGLVWVGRHSFALYLWHWPALVLLPRLAPGIPAAAILLVTTLCAALTHAFIEEPARRQAGVLPAIGAGFAAVAGLALWMACDAPPRYDVSAFARPHSSIRTYDLRPHPAPPTATFRRIFGEVEWAPTLATPECYAGDGIVVGSGTASPSIVVLGDSHGAMFAEVLRTAADRLGQRMALYCMNGGYSPFIEMPLRRRAATSVLSSDERYRFDEARLRAIEQWRPRVVVVCARWSLYDDSGGAFLEHLGRQGCSVLLVEQPPELAVGGDTSVIQFLAWKGVTPEPGVDHRLPQGNLSRVQAGRDRLRSIVDRHPHCRLVTTHDLYARGDRARVLDGRTVLYLDDDHLTTEGASVMLPRIIASLAQLLP